MKDHFVSSKLTGFRKITTSAFYHYLKKSWVYLEGHNREANVQKIPFFTTPACIKKMFPIYICIWEKKKSYRRNRRWGGEKKDLFSRRWNFANFGSWANGHRFWTAEHLNSKDPPKKKKNILRILFFLFILYSTFFFFGTWGVEKNFFRLCIICHHNST